MSLPTRNISCVATILTPNPSRMSRWTADGGRMNKTERIFKIEQLIAARKLVSFQTLQDELEVYAPHS